MLLMRALQLFSAVVASASAAVSVGVLLLRHDSIASSFVAVVVGLAVSLGLSVGIGNGIFPVGGVAQAWFLPS